MVDRARALVREVGGSALCDAVGPGVVSERARRRAAVVGDLKRDVARFEALYKGDPLSTQQQPRGWRIRAEEELAFQANLRRALSGRHVRHRRVMRGAYYSWRVGQNA